MVIAERFVLGFSTQHLVVGVRRPMTFSPLRVLGRNDDRRCYFRTKKNRNHIRAVEINPDRFELLKGNVKKSIAKSAHKTKTVRFFNENFLDVLEKEKGAIGAKRPVVFIDPPWGGEAYKKKVCTFRTTTAQP